MKDYLVTYCEMDSDGELHQLVERLQATSKVEALMVVVNMFETDIHSVSSVERIK